MPASDANKVNPTQFIITPGPVVQGAPVDDFTIQVGPSDANNIVPTTFVSAKVPAKDLTPQPDGTIVVPFPDVLTQVLADGVYGAKSEADSGAVISGDSPMVFFNIVTAPPVPAAPVAFSVAS